MKVHIIPLMSTTSSSSYPSDDPRLSVTARVITPAAHTRGDLEVRKHATASLQKIAERSGQVVGMIMDGVPITTSAYCALSNEAWMKHGKLGGLRSRDQMEIEAIRGRLAASGGADEVLHEQMDMQSAVVRLARYDATDDMHVVLSLLRTILEAGAP
jgi:hypothetical protein